jgi:tetratricopeptide (TPR) repeat protein
MHSCVHAWTKYVVNKRWNGRMARLPLKCVGLHVPSTTALQYWVTQRRLLLHASRVWGYIDAVLAIWEDDIPMMHAVHGLVDLYRDQGKLDKEEEIYKRALKEQKALGHDHTPNLGLLYADQGKLGEAEEMSRRAREGYEKRFGSDHSRCRSLHRALAMHRDRVGS